MKNLFRALCLLISSFALAQDPVPGYYITKEGQRVTGEYEYGDFSNAADLKFRTGQAEFTGINTQNIQEIGIGDSYKLVKYSVDIDGTDAQQGQYSDGANPVFEKQEVFLNVLIEGNASLYSYFDGRNTKFFYKTDAMSVPQQLVYRKYLINREAKENNEYKRQLGKSLICTAHPVKGNPAYAQKDLMAIVKAYNACAGGESVIYDNSTGKKFKINFSTFAGLYSTSFRQEMVRPDANKNDNSITVAVGGELELLPPSKIISFFARAEYEHINLGITAVNHTAENVTRSYFFNGDANMLSVSVGPRYYFNIGNNYRHRLFADVSACYSIALGGSMSSTYALAAPNVSEQGPYASFNMLSAFSLAGGAGYSFNNRLAVAIRANTARTVLNEPAFAYKATLARFGLSVQYTF